MYSVAASNVVFVSENAPKFYLINNRTYIKKLFGQKKE